MKFSDRIGATTPSDTLQIDTMDEGLSNKLWNIIYTSHPFTDNSKYGEGFKKFYANLIHNIFKKRLDTFSIYGENEIDNISNWYENAEWFEKYNFVEFVRDYSGEDYEPRINEVLAQEKAGYRFIDGVLVPITDKTEIEAIQASSSLPDKYSGARQHIKNATEAFSKKPSPDYAQVIQESISGVESIAKVITGKKTATLGKAISKLEKIKPMHGSMKGALHQLYGYTSDEEGLRHSMLTDETKISEADAHFMLVVCSAFINFAVAHYQAD